MKYTRMSRIGRALVVSILALFVIAFAFIGILIFQSAGDILNDKYVISDDCDFESITKA